MITVDDIFFAATQGNIPQLESLLQAREVNLNQLIDAGMNDGAYTQIPLLFSVMNVMKDQGIHPQALELLARYGADANGYVVLQRQEATLRIPLLAYVLQDWNSYELASFLLNHGADPNAVKEVRFASGYSSVFPMLYFALINPKGNPLVELLLRCGADPNAYVEQYVEQGGFYQYLPPIYYALVEQKSQEKCVTLFRYGASPQVTIEVGHGFAHKTNFQQYVKLVHPTLASMLESTFERAQALNGSGTNQYASAAPANSGVAAQPMQQSFSAQDQLRAQGRPTNAVPQVTSLRRCYGKFKAYLFGNFGILAIAFMVFAPLMYIGSDAEAAGIFFVLGIPCAIVAALIWRSVSRTAKERGQVNVMGRFVLDSFLVFCKVLLCMTVVLIPLGKALTSNIQWEDRATSSGGHVTVKKTGDGEYKDPFGNRYVDKR